MSFSHLLTEQVTYMLPTGVDKYGTFTYGAQQTTSAAVEQRLNVFRDDEGNERESSHTIVTDVLIAQGARVWIPGANTSDDEEAIYVIKTVQAPTRTTGLVMYECYLGI